MKSLLDIVLKSFWAMEVEAFQQLINVVQRDFDPVELSKAMHGSNYEKYLSFAKDGNPEALLKQGDEYLPGARNATYRKNVAVIPVNGPIFPRATMMSLSGGETTINSLSKDFNIALANDAISTIIMNYDTPGGEITGVSEFAQMMTNAKSRTDKKVFSYVYGYGASAGFWLACSGSEIWANDTAQVGSIGVVTGSTNRDEADKRAGITKTEIVSSVSPYKRVSMASEEGKSYALKMVNDLADIFISFVADNRHTTAENVIENFGKGGMVLAKDALKVGMIDKIASLEELIDANIINESFGGFSMSISVEELKAKSPETYNSVFDAGKALGLSEQKTTSEASIQAALNKAKVDGATEERTRIEGIMSLKIPGAESIVAENLLKPDATKSSVAILILEGQQSGKQNLKTALKEDNTSLLDGLKKVESNAPAGGKELTEEQLGRQMAALADGVEISDDK